MTDPLTQEQKEALFAHFREEWERLYGIALRSGAMSEEYGRTGDHRLAKFVICVAATNYLPTTRGDKDALNNLRRFI